MPKNDRGYALRLGLPGSEDLRSFPELERLAAEYRRLMAERQAAAQEVMAQEQNRHWAKQRDTAAFADALRRGEPDPGQAELREVDRQLADATRRGEALDQALSDLEVEIAQSIDRHRDEWIRRQIPLIADARAELAAAVEAWIDARRRLSDAEGMAIWLADFGGPKMMLRVRPARPAFNGLPLGANQAPPPWEAVAEAMRQELAASPFERRYADEPETQAVGTGIS